MAIIVYSRRSNDSRFGVGKERAEWISRPSDDAFRFRSVRVVFPSVHTLLLLWWRNNDARWRNVFVIVTYSARLIPSTSDFLPENTRRRRTKIGSTYLERGDPV